MAIQQASTASNTLIAKLTFLTFLSTKTQHIISYVGILYRWHAVLVWCHIDEADMRSLSMTICLSCHVTILSTGYFILLQDISTVSSAIQGCSVSFIQGIKRKLEITSRIRGHACNPWGLLLHYISLCCIALTHCIAFQWIIQCTALHCNCR